jgi:hypothetical protein
VSIVIVQYMLDSEPITTFVSDEIGLFGKCCEEGRFWRWHYPLLQGHAIEETDNALGARTEIVDRI